MLKIKFIGRRNQALVSLFLISFLTIIVACQSEKSPTEYQDTNEVFLNTKETWQGRVVYEIFIQAFADSDGDSIGDIKGVTQQLDYLKELGVGAIWLMPIHPSPSYHKYDVTDYKGIHPDYGSLEDFREMLREAHKRDIKVIIDLVLNHCSEDHPWFVEARRDPQSPYRDYFVWANQEEVQAISAREDSLAWTYHPSQWHENVYNPNDSSYYYGFFWKGM
ncbi:MAG: alpha-amylase family glycosyl hydrolase, partial [Bacteroidota bacterium]